MRRLTALLAGVSMCTALLAGCSSPSDTTQTTAGGASTAVGSKETEKGAEAQNSIAENEGKDVTIKVATWDYTANPTLSAVVAAFEEVNPHIKVEIIDVPSTDFNTKLNVMLNGGSDLDAYFIKEAPMTYDLYQKGQALDLMPFIERDGVDLTRFNGMDKDLNIEDKQYALPALTGYNVLYYNTEIFKRAGEPFPSNDMTWTEFEALARKMKTDDVYGAHFHTLATQVQNWGIQDGKNTVLDYDSGYDFLKAPYEMVLRLQKDRIIQDYGYLKSANINGSSAFKAGNVAMMPMGTWFIASMKTAVANGEVKAGSWGVATLPHPEGTEAGYTVGTSTPLAINAESKKQDAAWEFVKFVTGDEGATVYAENGALPGRLNDEMLKKIASLEGSPEGLEEGLAVKRIILDRPVAPHVTEMDNMMVEEHSMIMLGEIALEEGLAEITERSKEIQKK